VASESGSLRAGLRMQRTPRARSGGGTTPSTPHLSFGVYASPLRAGGTLLLQLTLIVLCPIHTTRSRPPEGGRTGGGCGGLFWICGSSGNPAGERAPSVSALRADPPPPVLWTEGGNSRDRGAITVVGLGNVTTSMGMGLREKCGGVRRV
jgi:hypothetical protein